MGDAQQLRQVIHNLLQNAQDACESNTASGAADDQVVIVIRTQYQRQTGAPEHPGLRRGFPDHILETRV
jgi:nitrogen fixation/metabolism regulation signal transduction histidine kinase